MKYCLIVDDSKVIRMVARKILEELEFETDEAADGKLALAACQRKMPDVILLDWYMPVMDGIDFLRALRTLPGGELAVGGLAGFKLELLEDFSGHHSDNLGIVDDQTILHVTLHFVRGIIRHFPDNPQIQGNRTTVPPPRELHPVRSHPMA